MAFPTFVGASVLQESINVLTVTDHADTASGDYQLFVIETADEAVSLSTAAGYTQHPGSPISAASGTLGIATRLTVYERIWNGTDGDPVLADSGNHTIATILSFRLASGSWSALSDVRSAVDGTGWNATAEQVEDTTGSMDGITTSVVDTLVVGLIATAKPDAAGGTAEMSAITNANLATITERFDDAAASGNGGWIGIWTGENASADAIGATTWTKATASYKAMLVTEIRPSSSVVDADAEVSFLEMEVPTANSRAEVSFLEVEIPTANASAQVGWLEFQVSEPDSAAQVSFLEVEVPTANSRAECSWLEVEVPTANARAEVVWLEMEDPFANARAECSWLEMEFSTDTVVPTGRRSRSYRRRYPWLVSTSKAIQTCSRE